MNKYISSRALEVFHARDVLRQLVRQQLILRYRRTALGYLWTLVNPLLMMTVMALVFSSLFKVNFEEFAVFLFAGMVPWSYFNSVSTQSAHAFINNEGLIKKIYIPKLVFPLSISVALMIDCILSFAALLMIIVIVGGGISWAVVTLPISFVLLFLFSFGIGLIASVMTVFFRDLQYVIIIAMQGLFFLTPVLYKHDALSGKVAWLVGLNPLVPFIELFRAPLYRGVVPEVNIIIGSFLWALFSVLFGLFYFYRQEKKIVYRL